MRYDVHLCNFELYECGWILASVQQPRPQGFSLKKWGFEGKALGTRLCVQTSPLPQKKSGEETSLNGRR